MDEDIIFSEIALDGWLKYVRCPICESIPCTNDSDNCKCAFCHHLTNTKEGGRLELIQYLKKDFLENNNFSSSRNLKLAVLIKDTEIEKSLHIQIHNFQKTENQFDSLYLQTLIIICIKLGYSKENIRDLFDSHELNLFDEKKRLIRNTENIVDKYKTLFDIQKKGTKESSIYDYKYEVEYIIEKINASFFDIWEINKIIDIIIDGYGQYGINRKLEGIEDIIDLLIIEENQGLVEYLLKKWIQIVIQKRRKQKHFHKKILLQTYYKFDKILRKLENKASIGERRRASVNHLGYLLSSLSLEAETYQERKSDISALNCLYHLDKSRDFTNWINLCELLISSDSDLQIMIPKWIEEYLIKMPHMIMKFEKIRIKLGVDFNYSSVVEGILIGARFPDVLACNHLSKILDIDKNILKNDRIIDAGKGEIQDLDFFKGIKNLKGFTLDIPNLIHLKQGLSHNTNNSLKREKVREAIEIVIDWINRTDVPVFIHSTPHTCFRENKAISLLFKHTKCYFLSYDYSQYIDEDLYFISFALTNNTWIISRDSFMSHRNIFSIEKIKLLNNRLFVPTIDSISDEIKFIKYSI
ncbi:hypothetical protein N8809_01835 [Euryarchaeota archaeon]|nr:hypothetical protein [Euryarchaeota archaeon]